MNRRDFLLSSTGLLTSQEVAWGAATKAQDPSAQKQSIWMEKIAKQLCKEFKVPAIWLACGTDGVIEQAVAGVRKLGDPMPALLDDRVMIASISKATTGLWIASLVEKGAIRYEATILELVPELSDVCRAEFRDVTLRELLSHTSAVTDRRLDADVVGKGTPFEMRLRIARGALSSPGSEQGRGKFAYCNANYTLAGLMVERATGVLYEEAFTHFFKKTLGLSSFSTEQPKEGDTTNEVALHEFKAGNWIPRNVSEAAHYAPQPSSGVSCTIKDLARFTLLCAQGCRGSSKMLNQRVWDYAIKAKPPLSGWGYGEHYDTYQISCGGSLWRGITSSVFALPEAELVCAIVMNAGCLYATEPKGKDIVTGCITKGRDLLVTELRHRRGQRIGPHSSVSINRVTTVNANGHEIVPKRSHSKVRVAIEVDVRGGRCGDIQITAKLGDEYREANYFRGLGEGHQRCATFEWDMPANRSTPFVAVIDASRSCGDPDPRGKRFEKPLIIEAD